MPQNTTNETNVMARGPLEIMDVREEFQKREFEKEWI